MRPTPPSLRHSVELARTLALSILLIGCGSSTMSGTQAIDAAGGGTDANSGAGGTTPPSGGAGGGTLGDGGFGGGAGGRDGAAGGATGSGGAAGTGGMSSASGGQGRGGSTGGGGGASTGGMAATGGRQGSGGRSGAGGSVDAGVDAASTCPAQLPISGGACQGSLTCSYGQSTCCGHSSSAWTCTCLGGTFSCSPTVECNIICPGQDASVGVDSAIDASTGRDASSVDGSGVGAACGGATDPPCAVFTYCEWSDNRCGAGVHGACAAIPRGVLCAIAPAPVCGCDGQNYPGECQAAQAGADVSSTASCTSPAGMFRCGWSYCQHGVEYCSAQVGGAVTNPGSYTCKSLPAACGGAPSCACVGASAVMCTTNAQGDVTVTLAVP